MANIIAVVWTRERCRFLSTKSDCPSTRRQLMCASDEAVTVHVAGNALRFLAVELLAAAFEAFNLRHNKSPVFVGTKSYTRFRASASVEMKSPRNVALRDASTPPHGPSKNCRRHHHSCDFQSINFGVCSLMETKLTFLWGHNRLAGTHHRLAEVSSPIIRVCILNPGDVGRRFNFLSDGTPFQPGVVQ